MPPQAHHSLRSPTISQTVCLEAVNGLKTDGWLGNDMMSDGWVGRFVRVAYGVWLITATRTNRLPTRPRGHIQLEPSSSITHPRASYTQRSLAPPHNSIFNVGQ